MQKTGKDVFHVIENMRSCHGNFTERKIPEELIERILLTGIRAATASAQQSYSVIVVDDGSRMKQICGYKGSHAFVFCADGNRLESAAGKLSIEFSGYYDMNAFLTWTVDALLAAQNCALAAGALGIASLFTNGIMRCGLKKAADMLKLPERGCVPVITLVLGYAGQVPSERKGRYYGAGLIHRNEYSFMDDKSIDEMILEYDDAVRNIHMTGAFAQKGYDHYIEWLYREWLASFPESQDDEFAEYLVQRGFLQHC